MEKNKIVIIIVGIIILAFAFQMLFSIEKGVGSGSANSQDFVSIKTQFYNGENVDKISNFSNMPSTKKDEYVTKLALSKGYEIFDRIGPEDGFETWYAINDSRVSKKGLYIIIQKDTGEVVIYPSAN